ncbi:MAG: hypothetical protein H7A53_06465 [Akkermansiaceae bacterium]|nr:hypothetical protein [Akkermansiaceae bacterium]
MAPLPSPTESGPDVSDWGWKRLFGWLGLSQLGLILFIWCPMALRWPLRILILTAVFLAVSVGAGRVRRATPERRLRVAAATVAPFLALGVLNAAIAPYWKVKVGQVEGRLPVPSTDVSVERVVSLRDELRDRGVNLSVLALPHFRSLFPEHRSNRDLPVPVEAKFVAQALERIEDTGVAVLDLTALIQDHAGIPSLWHDDRIHLRPEGFERLAEPLAAELAGLGVKPSDSGKSVLMGNCFAGFFASTIRERVPGWNGLRGLTAFGDLGRVADALFLFPEEYLDGTAHVVWLMPHEQLISSSLPRINFHPDLDDKAMKAAVVEVTSALAWGRREEKERLPTLPYANGLVTIGMRVLEGDVARESDVIGLGYGIKDRELAGLGRLKTGKRLKIHLLPFDAFLSKNPKIAAEYRLNDSDDHESPRFWIHSWTEIR